jgi:hypothetical protein
MERRLALTLLVSVCMMALYPWPSDGASVRGRIYSDVLSREPGAGYATGNGEQVSQPATGSRAPDPLDVKDTIEFFTWYLKTKESMTRGEFETDAAYQKRLPPPFDSRKTIYFRVQRGLQKLYRYDLATQTLTLTDSLRQVDGDSYKRAKAEYDRAMQRYIESIGSGAEADKPTRPQPGDFEPWYEWNILTSIASDAAYIAQNAFGASVAVHAYTTALCKLVFVNGGSIPGEVSEDDGPLLNEINALRRQSAKALKYEYFPPLKKKVAFSFNLAPEEAERVSQAYEIVLGVSLLGYTQSEVKSSRPLRPTLKSPSDWTFINVSIQAVLREIIVRDRNTYEVLKKVSIEPAQEGTADTQETVPKPDSE